MMEAQGQIRLEDIERSRTETLLGMSQQRLAAANQARQQATGQLIGGIGGVIAGGVGAMANEEMLGDSSGLVQTLFGYTPS